MFSVRGLVRILKDMQKHVPGLQQVESWYIQLLVNYNIVLLLLFFCLSVLVSLLCFMCFSATVQWFHLLVMSRYRWWMPLRGYGSFCQQASSCPAQLVYLTLVRYSNNYSFIMQHLLSFLKISQFFWRSLNSVYSYFARRKERVEFMKICLHTFVMNWLEMLKWFCRCLVLERTAKFWLW